MQKSASTPSPSQRGVLVATSFMLFSMFFGAGNLIVPTMLGASAGENFIPAIIGFLIAGVALPVISIIAVAVSGEDLSDLSRRAGVIFGWMFPVLVYMSIGPFYALPRLGSVAFETATVPLTGSNSTFSTIVFNVVFFGVAMVLSWNSSRILDAVGRILTPLLLGLLAILIVLSLIVLEPTHHAPSEAFVEQPAITGLLNGYLTMDAIAALVFGIIVIRALRKEGGISDQRIVSQTALAAIIAASLLAVVYVGLGRIGYTIPNPESYDHGAKLLADAASLTMGNFGLILFGLTVLAACLTTAVGLLSACSGFFQRLFPAVRYHSWLMIFTAISTYFAVQGLDVLLAVAGPLIGFLYPIGITLVLLTLISRLVVNKTSMRLTYRLGTAVAVLWSGATTLTALSFFPSILGETNSMKVTGAVRSFLEISPWQSYELGWLVPVLVTTVIGLAIDLARSSR